MNFHVLTLFPEMIEQGVNTSITGRAINNGLLSINAVNIRDYAFNKHNSVDDYPYGGGAGMLMQAEPVYLAYEAVKEQIDKRKQENIKSEEVTSTEPAAMVMIDTISRLVPGVLHNDVSAEFESFQDNLLEYPQYSRPEEWRGKKVPPILLSGHHANIEKWRREQSILRTMERRPDLLKESNLTDKEKKWIRQVKRERKEAEKIK